MLCNPRMTEKLTEKGWFGGFVCAENLTMSQSRKIFYNSRCLFHVVLRDALNVQ